MPDNKVNRYQSLPTIQNLDIKSTLKQDRELMNINQYIDHKLTLNKNSETAPFKAISKLPKDIHIENQEGFEKYSWKMGN